MEPLTFSDGIEVEIPKKKTPREVKKQDVKTELEGLISATMEERKAEQLLNLIEEIDFYKAPASSRFHGNYAGGLADHTLLVVRHMLELNQAWDASVNEGSLVMTGILHDIAKGGVNEKPYYEEYFQKNGDQKFKSGKGLPAVGQNTMSLVMAFKAGIDLSWDEVEGIMGQDGMYTNEGRVVWESEETPSKLAFIMHFADHYVSAIHGI